MWRLHATWWLVYQSRIAILWNKHNSYFNEKCKIKRGSRFQSIYSNSIHYKWTYSRRLIINNLRRLTVTAKCIDGGHACGSLYNNRLTPQIQHILLTLRALRNLFIVGHMTISDCKFSSRPKSILPIVLSSKSIFAVIVIFFVYILATSVAITEVVVTHPSCAMLGYTRWKSVGRRYEHDSRGNRLSSTVDRRMRSRYPRRPTCQLTTALCQSMNTSRGNGLDVFR